VAERQAVKGWQTVAALALGVVALVAVVFVARVFWGAFADLDPQVAAAISIALATVVVVPLTRYFDRRRTREEPLQLRKVEVYERFIRGFLDNFFDNKRGGMESEKLATFMFEITPDMTIWSSDEVVRRWSVLRRQWANMDGDADPEMLLDLERLFLAIRADLGHRNKDLQTGDVLGLWVNDIGDWSKSRDK
jgi:hypothetical protein